MRTFKKGENIWQSKDEVTIKALLNSGYEEVVKAEIEPEVVKPKKRSKIED